MAQLLLLVWKNFVQQKRKPVTTVLQIVFPILFMVVMALLRTTSKDEYKCVETDGEPGCQWKPFSVTNPSIPLALVIERTYKKNMSELIPDIIEGKVKLKIGYSPNASEFVNSAMSNARGFIDQYVPEEFKQFSSVLAFEGFATETEMVAAIMQEANDDAIKHKQFFGSVAFDPAIGHASSNLDYAIRMGSDPLVHFEQSDSDPQQGGRKNWLTDLTFPIFILQGPRAINNSFGGEPYYYENFYLNLQHSINAGLVHTLRNGSTSEPLPDVQMRRFPFPEFLENRFISAVQFGLPLLVFLAYILTALVLVRDIVREKERRLKESMKMMGLSNLLHWTAWFINYFFTLLISIIAMVLILKYGRVLEYSNPLIVLLFFICHAWSTIMFCFFVSTLFQRAVWGAAGGGIFWFLSYTPYFFVQQQYDTLSFGAKVGTGTFFNVAMAYGAQLIGNFEGQGSGVQWSNLNVGTSVDDSFTFATVLGLLVFDGFLYGLLAWYIEGVYPGQFGLPLPFYFPFMPSYWCSPTSKITDEDEETETMPLSGSHNKNASKHLFEPEPESLPAGVRSYRLKKVFKTSNGPLVAVNGVSLNMYEGQVTVLLGHNGAGKTTFISTLTGLFPPTSGSAYVNNCSILNNISGVRDSLGICPQHDILFDNLTVQEHLEFYAQLKGCKRSVVKAEVDKMLAALKFTQFRTRRAKELSGGMKRKLSVGIALVGGSKVVILDEPTSGMDPAARRATWDLINQFKEDRTILLTTHFMDEADLLGDRIAIMSSGNLKCCGSSLFLKSRYGVGYHIIMVREEGCDIERVVSMVKSHVPEATVESTSGAELSLILPKESASAFPAMFNELQANSTELGISSYGVSVTTMEEVFIKAGEEGDSLVAGDGAAASADHLPDGSSSSSSTDVYGSTETNQVTFRRGGGGTRASYQLLHNETHVDVNEGPRRGLTPDMLSSGMQLLLRQFYALIVKRIIHTMRNKSGAFTQLFWPGLFTLFGLIAIKTIPVPKDSPSRLTSYSYYGSSSIYYNDVGGPSTPYSQAFAGQFANTSYVQVQGTSETMGNWTEFGDYLRNATDSDGQNNIANFNKHHLTGAFFQEDLITVYFNNIAFHAISESLAAVGNGLLQREFPGKKISVTNHPLPRTAKEEVDQLRLDGSGFALSFDVLFGMAFLASSFVRLVVAERENKAKHVQFVSGVHPVSYWLSAIAWDLINYMAPVIMILVLFGAFQTPAYTKDGNIGLVFLSLLLYGWAIIPLMYLVSFAFSKPASAFILLTLFNIVTGEVAIIVIFILDILKEAATANALKWVFLFLPNFCLGQALSDLYTNYATSQLCEQSAILEEFCIEQKVSWQSNYLSLTPPGIGRYLVFMAGEGILFFLLVLLVESDFSSWIRTSLERSAAMDLSSNVSDEDEDVRSERLRVESLDNRGRVNAAKANPDILVVRDLNKIYNPLPCMSGSSAHAVQGISVGVPTRECFGLLGVNGAGKTTTFGMLTGDIPVSAGNAYLDGHSIVKDQQMVRQRIGYCPQVNGLIDLLTGRELLTMFARLRGVPERLIPGAVQKLIESLLLQKHADRPCGTYSGGNKRKLCTAIALVGDPPVVYLDEPTTGMDPVARRQLWQALCREREQGCCVVITSHSMEECEALCTRLAIMVSGRFRCLGSPQHLKNRFGDGYTVSARLREGVATDDFKSFMVSTFPDCNLKEEHFGQVTYQVRNSTLADIFEVVENHKDQFSVEDYSVSQTTLEQVFLLFARPDIDKNVQDWMH
ncbi:phospholipid-transporting ATPase ABCA3-like [Sycon ciliatum]|uniref:phospholipid-transporting ATPase ABCA3-like n=1 Tax=Sycon ciliatum TaxID=27933 RepID=UPI0031F660A2